jgi:hypothetical protein
MSHNGNASTVDEDIIFFLRNQGWILGIEVWMKRLDLNKWEREETFSGVRDCQIKFRTGELLRIFKYLEFLQSEVKGRWKVYLDKKWSVIQMGKIP